MQSLRLGAEEDEGVDDPFTSKLKKFGVSITLQAMTSLFKHWPTEHRIARENYCSIQSHLHNSISPVTKLKMKTSTKIAVHLIWTLLSQNLLFIIS